MKYQSTRAEESSAETGLTFEQVLFAPGYASDGGLYVPQRIPRLKKEELLPWKTYSYRDVVKAVLKLFVSEEELPAEVVSEIVNSAFCGFSSPEVVNTVHLNGGLIIAELFHGPTLAFKDLSLAVLAKLLDCFLTKKGTEEKYTVLVGTSGDTGPAAAYSIAGLSRLNLVLLYPKNRVSQVQELQMLTVTADNIHVYSVDGTSDDLDVPIKQCFQDREFSRENSLCSFNSLQWGRVLLQIAHYIYVYCQCAQFGEELTVVVPTGAAGNLAAGYIARQIGFPITLVAAVNSNDILYRTLSTGDMSLAPQVKTTLAPAMDIQAPYNIERLLYFACGEDRKRVREIMMEFESTGSTQLPADVLGNLKEFIKDTVSVDDAEITSTMKRCYEENDYQLCPHTATAVSYFYEHKQPAKVCLATASPSKFLEACSTASFEAASTDHLEALKRFSETCDLTQPKGHFQRGENWTEKLKKIILSVR